MADLRYGTNIGGYTPLHSGLMNAKLPHDLTIGNNLFINKNIYLGRTTSFSNQENLPSCCKFSLSGPDGAGYGGTNVEISSWNGIGFLNTCTAGLGVGCHMYIDARYGHLSAKGTITGSRTYNAVANDYAEFYEKYIKEEHFEPGDVIILEANNKYTKSKEAYSNLVVGVYSDDFGHIVGGHEDKSIEENYEEFIPIGLAGRIDVKCSDEDVKPGDILVSSYVEGHAMVADKSKNLYGTILGKAIGYWKDGKVKMQIMLG